MRRHRSELANAAYAPCHKWMWNPKWDGLPPQSFHPNLTRSLTAFAISLGASILHRITLRASRPAVAKELGLRAGIPVPVGAFDAHWDAIGAGCREGDVVNVVGTSTCIIADEQEDATDSRRLCVCRAASIRNSQASRRASRQLAISSRPCAPRRREGRRAVQGPGSVSRRTERPAEAHLGQRRPNRAGQLGTGWCDAGLESGDTAQDELFAAIEGTAFHTRIILERMAEYGVPVDRVINAGGIPQNNAVLNQVYADVLGKPVLVPPECPPAWDRPSLRCSRLELFQR